MEDNTLKSFEANIRSLQAKVIKLNGFSSLKEWKNANQDILFKGYENAQDHQK